MNDQTVTHLWQPVDPRLTVKLERGMKGAYAWEIRYEGNDPAAVLLMLQRVDNELSATYGSQP